MNNQTQRALERLKREITSIVIEMVPEEGSELLSELADWAYYHQEQLSISDDFFRPYSDESQSV